MDVLALILALFLLMADRYSDATYCVCRTDLSDSVLQKSLDYACGAGADCGPINQNGACYQPNTVKAHCSYAVNSYFQRKGQATGSCVFSNTATTTESDPSPGGGCVYPASPSTSTGNTSTSPTPTPPSILTPGTPTGGTTPTTPTPPGTGTGTGTGTGGSIPAGFGPSTTPIGPNPNHANHPIILLQTKSFSSFLILILVRFSSLAFLWG